MLEISLEVDIHIRSTFSLSSLPVRGRENLPGGVSVCVDLVFYQGYGIDFW